MKRISICVTALLFILVSGFNSSAQLSDAFLLDNVSSSGVQIMFFKNKVLRSGSYMYTCGATINDNGNYDILLSKLDGTTDTLMWSVSYNGGYDGDDYAADIVVDGSSNVYVVGTTQVGSLDYNAIVIKYNSSGIQQWASTYAGAASGPDGFTTVVLNGTDVYASGGAVVNVSNMTDVLCVKYNSSGVQQWATTWNNSSTNLHDAAANISIAGSNIAVVAATQETLGTPKWKVATLRMNSSTGSVIDVAISSGGSATSFTEIRDIAVDNNDNIYVCGTRTDTGQGKNIYVVKYNASLTQAWTYTKNGSGGGDDEGIGLELNGSSVFISGYTTATGEGRNLYAAKLAQSNGAVNWEVSHHLADGDDEATGLQIDSGVNLIIPCNVDRNSTKDIAIVKLSSNTGSNLATNFYNSEYNRDEFARDVAVNTVSNDVYISTQVQVNDTTYESRIIKWRQTKVYSPVPTDAYSSYGGYIPNNTQLRATDSTANRTVRFYNQANAIATYIDDSKISYQLVLANDTTNADTTYRVDMALIGGKPNAKVYPYKERKEYINYYLGHMDKPSVRTPLSNVILKQDVYTNTDFLFTSSPTGFRHWFIARTGATPTSYQMSFTGQTGLSVDGSGNLLIATTIGTITYKKAKAYAMNTTTGALTLLGWQPSYSISSGVVSFTSIGAWSGTPVLQVDEKEPAMMGFVPISNENLNWSTFFGGSGFDYSCDVANDSNGVVWYTGYGNSAAYAGIPGEEIGSVLTSTDVFIVNFDEDCGAQWAVYYGGNAHDFPTGIAIDENGNSYCVGVTNSNDLISYTPLGMNYEVPQGGQEGFFLKLRSDGTITVDSYIGGASTDETRDIAFRPAGNGLQAAIFIVGSCLNPSGFPIQFSGDSLGYNQPHSGNSDGFIMELSQDGYLNWSTFFGSSDAERIFGVESVGGLPTIIGTTTSQYYSEDQCIEPSDGKFPSCAATGSWQQPEFSANDKYFIAQFETNKKLVYSTYYGSVLNYYGIWQGPSISCGSLEYTPNTDFYICGFTMSDNANDFPFTPWPSPEYPNAYYKEFSTEDSLTFAWLGKFKVNDTIVSHVGNTAFRWEREVKNIYIAADKNSGVFVSGSGTASQLQSISDYCLTPIDDVFPLCDNNGQGYLEDNLTNLNGTQRAFVMHFDNLMQIDWSTQFGGSPSNEIHCISVAGDNLFIGGNSSLNYTLWEYDEMSDDDYYLGSSIGFSGDAVFTRFATPVQIVSNDEISGFNHYELTLYPNPTNGLLNVVLPREHNHNMSIEIFDVTGKLILKHPIKMDTQQVLLDFGQLSSGLYILRYNSNEMNSVKSFVKQ